MIERVREGGRAKESERERGEGRAGGVVQGDVDSVPVQGSVHSSRPHSGGTCSTHNLGNTCSRYSQQYSAGASWYGGGKRRGGGRRKGRRGGERYREGRVALEQLQQARRRRRQHGPVRPRHQRQPVLRAAGGVGIVAACSSRAVAVAHAFGAMRVSFGALLKSEHALHNRQDMLAYCNHGDAKKYATRGPF